MKNAHVYLLAAALVGIGAAVFLYKVLVVGLPVSLEEKTELWEVETAISFNAKGRSVNLSFHLPQNADRFSVVNQNFVSRGYGISTREDGINRRATLTIRQEQGKQTLYYGFVVLRGKPGIAKVPDDEPIVRRYKMTEQERVAAKAIIKGAEAQSADTASFVVQVLKRLSGEQPTRPAATLLGQKATTRKTMAVAAKIMGLANMPARAVHGIALGLDRRHAQFEHWLEVHDGNKWLPFREDATGPGLAPDQFVWWRGPAPFAEIKGGDLPRVTITVNRIRSSTLQVVRTIGETARDPVLTWSLYSLPLQTQLVFRLLLVVPLGVFLLVVLRNVVGIKTFGTFMPVLIALAFRETGLAWGVVLFTVVVAGGLLVRLYLEHLKLLLVPRLGAVLIVVIILMAGLSLFSHKLDIVSGLSVALFPMVILTMTIERMSVVWDERGPTESLKEGLGSLVVAIFCFLVMSVGFVEHLMFAFPELLLILLAATVLLGRYSGFRLTEIIRFRVLGDRST